jgi:hypothetical protein
MASALDTIAHLVLPNLMKIKGASTLVGAMERGDVSPFNSVWEQTGVEHSAKCIAKEKDPWRYGVLSLPTPKEMGEAYMCVFMAKKNDAAMTAYFTLEYDYVLATKQARTVIVEMDGKSKTKHGEGPAVTGDFQTDAAAFIDAVNQIVTRRSAPKLYT